MTARTLWRAALGALALISLAFVGCDERNDADVPQTVYHLTKSITTPGTALGVDISGDLLGVAAAAAGTFVYDISYPVAPQEIFHFVPNGVLFTELVGVDPVNRMVISLCGPSAAPGEKYPIHHLTDSTRIGGATFTSGAKEVEIVSEPNKFIAWKLEVAARAVTYSSYCYIPDSARWGFNFCSEVYSQMVDVATYELPRGFGFRDSLFAVPTVSYEVKIFNINTGTTHSTTSVPGDPYDCAWADNLIVVADNFLVTILDAANLAAPVIRSTLIIPGADRLQRVVVDGNYAILLDDADGVYVVDISNADSPKMIQSIALPEISGISADHGTLAISDAQLGVLIYKR